MKEKDESKFQPGWQWLGRNLDNYKSQHAKTAADKGITHEFKSAKTLTEARKILHGLKKKNT